MHDKTFLELRSKPDALSNKNDRRVAYGEVKYNFAEFSRCSASLQNLDLINSFSKKVPIRIFWDKIINKAYNWSYNYGYMDAFYETSLIYI